MWAYFNVKKRIVGSSGYLTRADMLADTKAPSIETTEHAIRMDGKSPVNLIELYGRTWCMDGRDYQFDRFDSNGSAIFVRSE